MLFLLSSALAAMARARLAIASVAVTYVVFVALGIGMVSTGNAFAIERRDAIVAGAQSSDILVANRSGDHLKAAVLDFASNLVGSVVSAVAGITVIGSYPIIAYRGWVGGIVSIDALHQSRLGDARKALYYVVTLVLQLIPYSIAGGVGIRLGLGAWRQTRGGTAKSWLGLPIDLMQDAARAFVVITPLFLGASLWEFLF